MPFKRTQAIHIDAPPEAVFDYVTDLTRHPEWASQPMEMTVNGDAVRAGTAFSTTVRFLKPIAAEGRVIEMQSPGRFVYECSDSSGIHRWTIAIGAEAAGARLEQTIERIQAPIYVKVVQAWVMWPLLGRPQIRKGLANIKARVEASLRAAETV